MALPTGIRRCRSCKKDLTEADFHRGSTSCKSCKADGQRERRDRERSEVHSEDLAGKLIDYVPFANPQQAKVIELLNELHTVSAVAARLGIKSAQVLRRITLLKSRAARRGFAPEHDQTKTVPAGQHIRGVSNYYSIDENGKSSLKGQWVKSKADDFDRLQMIKDAAQELAQEYRGMYERIPAQQWQTSNLLTVYPMGDPHFGMFSWHEETGEDFDLEIAKRNLYAAVDKLVSLAPPGGRALVISLGDFFHADNKSAQTTRGTRVDVDSRWPKVLQAGIGCMRQCINRALERHDFVDVIIEIGNHDDHSSIFLAMVLKAYYENEPRVSVDTSPAKFHYYRFGKNLIGVTHGDTCKLKDLNALMAAHRPKDWGDTKHRSWYTGHVHHESVKELTGGVRVETFRTLAPGDAWHAASGYHSGRDMRCDVIHKEYGRLTRHIVGIEQLHKEQENDSDEI
jgi:hypothetical protein